MRASASRYRLLFQPPASRQRRLLVFLWWAMVRCWPIMSETCWGRPEAADLEKILPGQYSHTQTPELGSLQTGEGELRVIDRAFGKSPALLVRGDAQGQAAALAYGSEHLPYLWEPSKKYESADEMRLDVQRFFSLRSSAGQASAALYHLDTWASELASSSQGKTIASVRAEVDVDEADPKLKQFIHDQLAQKLHTADIEVVTRDAACRHQVLRQ